MTTFHLHPVHPAVYGAEACRDRARRAGHQLRDRRDALEVEANRLFHRGDTNGDMLAAAHARTCDDAALDAFGAAAGFDACVDDLRELEAEVVRLLVEVAEARATEAAAVVAWLRGELPEPHLFDPCEKWDVAIEWAANEIERGAHHEQSSSNPASGPPGV